MNLTMLKSKIHKACVTSAELEYDGSLEIDETLMKTVNLLPYEQIDVYNITNGCRFTTYVIKGKRGSGDISVKGAAARLVSKGDIIIIASYAQMDEIEAKGLIPKVVLLDKNNKIKK